MSTSSPESAASDAPFLTVGRLREAMQHLPDEAQMVVTSSPGHRFDLGIVETLTVPLIRWDHNCDDAPEADHQPGADCPVVPSLELWLDDYDEAVANAQGGSDV
jgi:hypothetical protein